MNGYLGGQMQAYFGRLQSVTAAAGMATTLYTTKSNGGLMTAQSAVPPW